MRRPDDNVQLDITKRKTKQIIENKYAIRGRADLILTLFVVVLSEYSI